jgi:hypothetical protein
LRHTLNLPVANALEARVSGTNPLPASSGVVGVGVVGVMIVGQSVDPSTKDARNVNCFKHTVGKTVYAVKRSGVSSHVTTTASSVASWITVWSGQGSGDKVISAFGAVSSSIYDGQTLLPTNNSVTTNISTRATSITETLINNVPTLTITGANNSGWWYQNGGTISSIASAGWPGNATSTVVGPISHLDGFAFVMTSVGGIHNSQLNTISTWPASGSIDADIYPDAGVGCVRWRQYLIGFGSQSMEFFYNAGNAQGSPLTRLAHMAQRIGAVHADAITQIADTIFFCGSTSQGGLTVYQFDGTVNRISPSEIDAVLLLAGGSNIELTAFRDYGLNFLDVKAGTSIYRYCVEEKFWFPVTSTLGFMRWAGLATGNSQVVYGVSELVPSGRVYVINHASRTYLDAGNVFSARIQLPPIEPGNGSFVSYEEAQIVGDVEVSSSPGDLNWTDDDYMTYSNPRTLDLSENVPKTTRLGGTKNPRAFGYSHGADTPMRLRALRVTVNVGK